MGVNCEKTRGDGGGGGVGKGEVVGGKKKKEEGAQTGSDVLALCVRKKCERLMGLSRRAGGEMPPPLVFKELPSPSASLCLKVTASHDAAARRLKCEEGNRSNAAGLKIVLFPSFLVYRLVTHLRL